MIRRVNPFSLQSDLDEARRALQALEGELGVIRLDPNSAESVEAAIRFVEQKVDERVGAFESNPIIGSLMGVLKKKYQQEIRDKAALAGPEPNEQQSK